MKGGTKYEALKKLNMKKASIKFTKLLALRLAI